MTGDGEQRSVDEEEDRWTNGRSAAVSSPRRRGPRNLPRHSVVGKSFLATIALFIIPVLFTSQSCVNWSKPHRFGGEYRKFLTFAVTTGEMPEWSIGAVSKTAVPSRVPGVRIPLSPPKRLPCDMRSRRLLFQASAKRVWQEGWKRKGLIRRIIARQTTLWCEHPSADHAEQSEA